MLRDLEYQARVLRTFDDYLAELARAKSRADKVVAANARETDPDLFRPVPDFAAQAWEAMRAAGKLAQSRLNTPFSPRRDGMNRPVPNVVFKVPTGGGKTYLAVSAVSRIFGHYMGRNTGFLLWIVPNEAIYSQTLKYFRDRQHPYRQMLDRAAAGRVCILEKGDRLDARDVEGNLCVMLLMLQSANRQTRESLKMFQDRGDVHGFFPPEGDQEAHKRVMDETTNLDPYKVSTGAGSFWPHIKDSLGNALRLIRPVVVMDEGHRAVSDLAFSTLFNFNPCFVLELSATPRDVAGRHANVLVEILGTDLDREGMIKMPLNLDPHQGTDWKATLAAALTKLNELEGAARTLHANGGNYIRPILLVQVERTGDEQRDGAYIHARDAKDWLKTAGLDDAEIAVKTANVNELSNPENQDLLSPLNRVRVIITKQALQEGWDCPFAYVLCSLAASSNLDGMTQLVGRILRQPHAQKTGVGALDECYVVTHHAATGNVVQAIKQGLENDGMGDLVTEIKSGDPGAQTGGPQTVHRRDVFRKTEIYLPRVLRVENGCARPLDYEADVLAEIDWRGLDVTPFVTLIPDHVNPADTQMRRIRLTDAGDQRIVADAGASTVEALRFDPVFAVRMISDLIPNAWVAREVVGSVLHGLRGRGFTDDKLGQIAGLIGEELRRWLDMKQTELAEAVFRAEVAAGRIQFRLRLDGDNWRMPHSTEVPLPDRPRMLLKRDGTSLKRSLFSPIYEEEFSNQSERDVALHLDGERALKWWHRNVARLHYSVQGWRREKIYPDFIFAVQQTDNTSKLVVLEMKGDQLAGNLDTNYKRAVLDLLTDNFAWDSSLPAGSAELVQPNGDVVVCELVLMSEWQMKRGSLLSPTPKARSGQME